MNPTGDTPVTSQGLPMPPIDDNTGGSPVGGYPGGYPGVAATFPQGYYTNANSYADSFGAAAAGGNTKYYPTGYPYGPSPGGGGSNGPPGGGEEAAFAPHNGRDLNYYGYNNGFGNNGGGDSGGGSGASGGGFFASSTQNPQDNNNKLSDSSGQVGPGQESPLFGDTKVKLENNPEHSSSHDNKLPIIKSDTTDNSDNQVDSDLKSNMTDMKSSNPSPTGTTTTHQGLKRSLSPGGETSSADNPNFEAQNLMGSEEYMRQQQMLGPDGKTLF